MGWTQNGFYTIAVAENVINSEQNRLATVYCDFSKATSEETTYNNYKHSFKPNYNLMLDFSTFLLCHYRVRYVCWLQQLQIQVGFV